MKNKGFLTAAALLMVVGASVPAHAQQDKHERKEANKQRREEVKEMRQEARISQQEQAERIRLEQQRTVQYQTALERQVQLANQRNAALQQAKRMEAYRYQQQYVAALQRQQAQLRAARNYNNDPYYYTASSYRYNLNGVARQTNTYGAQLLRQAVNQGYAQGRLAGRADRADRAPFNYRDEYAYQDANYGYNGNYVEQGDYNYYFRQGFQRGYEDGYYARSRYGTYNNGTANILSNLVSGIIGLTQLH